MRRIFALVIACAMILNLSACGSGTSSTVPSSSSSVATSSSSVSSDASSTDGVSKSEGLFNVTITYPADWVGESTQSDLDQEVEESNGGIKSATLNEDGTATYVMSKAYQDKLLQDISDNITEDLNALVGSDDYPSFTAVETNSDFTQFTITTTSSELDLNEAFSVMLFYMYSGLYSVVSGEPVENVHVDFVNADTGEIIESSDSADTEDSAG